MIPQAEIMAKARVLYQAQTDILKSLGMPEEFNVKTDQERIFILERIEALGLQAVEAAAGLASIVHAVRMDICRPQRPVIPNAEVYDDDCFYC